MARFDVTLAGEITMDLVMYGLPEELPLERELLSSGMAMTLGGSSAITAHNLSALGSRTGFIAQRADDPFTELCFRELTEAGVDVTMAAAPKQGVGTGLTVFLQHGASRRAFTYSGTIGALRYEDLDLEYLCAGRHFHLSSFFLQSALQPDVPKLMAEMQRAGLTTSMDTNDDPEDRWGAQEPDALRETLKHVDIFMPNEREARCVSGELDIEDAMRKLAEIVPMLVVKRGAAGAMVVKGRQRWSEAATPTKVMDAVGAGDSFNAGFLHGLLHGQGIADCLRLGNACGALSTTASGGTTAFRDAMAMEEFFAGRGVRNPAAVRGAKAIEPVVMG